MSKSHLKDLRNAIEASHWRIAEVLPGDDYRISASWVLVRPDGSGRLHLDFEGIDDLRSLPIEQSCGCQVREVPERGLYFARIKRSWKDELSGFVTRLRGLQPG